MSILGMSNISDNPNPSVISHDLWMEDDSVRKEALANIASSIIDRHIDLATMLRVTLVVGNGNDGAEIDDGGDAAADDEGGRDNVADGAEIDDGDVAMGHTKGGGGGSLYDCM